MGIFDSILGSGGSQPMVDMGNTSPPDPSPAPVAPQGGWLNSVLDITPEQGRNFAASLGAGLSNAGNSWNRPGLAAFASGMGAAMQGGDAAQQQAFKNRMDLLDRAIKAKAEGDMAEYRRRLLDIYKLQRQGTAMPPDAPPTPPAQSPAAAPVPPAMPLTPAAPPAQSSTALPRAVGQAVAPGVAVQPVTPSPPRLGAPPAVGVPPGAGARPAGNTPLAANPDYRARQLAIARDAIGNGADRRAVEQRLREGGIDPSGL